jgi:thiaminase
LENGSLQSEDGKPKGVNMSHPARIYHSLDELLADVISVPYDKNSFGYRYWMRKWNKHVAKHGNTPYMIKCSLCSGKEFKEEVLKKKTKFRELIDNQDMEDFNERYNLSE